MSRLVACSLVLLTPFVIFVRYYDYSLLRAEILISAAGLVGVGLVAGLISSVDYSAVRVLIFSFFVVLFVDIQTEAIDSWLSCAFFFVPLSAIGYFARDRLGAVVTFLAGVMIVSTLLIPAGEGASTLITFDPAATSGNKPPPVVHIILDEHIGMQGIPEEFDSEHRLRNQVRDRYLGLGFSVFGRAFSRHYFTSESIASLVNFSDRYQPQKFVKSVSTNPYFEEMTRRGYEVHVLQSDWLDYCRSSGKIQMANCYTYKLETIKAIESQGLEILEKAQIIIGMFMRLSFVATQSRALYNDYAPTWRKAGIAMPDWPEDLGRVSTLSAMSVLPILESRLAAAKPGELHFVHLMLPHFPYAYRRDCSLRPDPAEWLTSIAQSAWPRRQSNDTRAQRYPLYLEQLECVTNELTGMFERLDQGHALDDATVIIHSDHGSRLDRGPPIAMFESKLDARDYTDAFSSFFAIRLPGLLPHYDLRSIATEELFNSVISKGTIPQGRSWIRSPNVYLTDKDAKAVARPMRWAKSPSN